LIVHQTPSRAICFRADGKALLTASWDKTARIWDIATGKPLGPPLQHRAQVESGDLSPDGAMAITLCQRRPRCWFTASGMESSLIKFRDSVRAAVAFSPDGKWVAAAEEDRLVQLWDRQTKRRGHTFRCPRDAGHLLTLRLSSDSALLAAGYEQGIIQLWDTRTGQELHTLSGSRERIQFVAISPDGTTLASGSERSPVVRLWDVRTGQEVASLEGHTVGHVTSLAFTSDGTMLISATADGVGHAEIGRWSAPPVVEDSPRK
jgi:WD40 repeat protein